MRTTFAVILRSILILTAPGTALIAQDTGSIRGTVVDEIGIPIAAAKVNATSLNGRPMAKFIRYVETDGQGHFLIDRLEWGKYGVFAMKEESAYPDMGASLYSNDVFPTAAITPWSPVAELRIQLGPKAGIVAGSLTNASNGAPLNAGFKLTRASAPDKWLSTSTPPDYRVLVPSGTAVLVEVSAPGFKTWTPGHPLLLEPGAEMHLDIPLEPLHDPTLHAFKFLVPEGFIGWLLLECSVKDTPPAKVENDIQIFKFPRSGELSTSSSGPERGAEGAYFYYSENGSVREIPTDYRNGKGMIWGQHEGTRNGALSQFGFFVGTEQQYKKYQTRQTHPGPIITR